MKCELTVVWTVEEVDIEPNKCDFDEMWIKCSLNRWGRYWTWQMWRIWDLNEPNVQPHERLSQYSIKIFKHVSPKHLTTSSQASKLSLSETLPSNLLTRVKCRAIYVAKNMQVQCVLECEHCKFDKCFTLSTSFQAATNHPHNHSALPDAHIPQ